MASGASSMDSTGSNGPGGTLPRPFSSSNGGSVGSSAASGSDCDAHELNTLRRQHSDTGRRLDHAMKELEYYRNQHRAAMEQLQASNQESSNLRAKCAEFKGDKLRAEREIQHLQKEVSTLHSEAMIPENGNPDAAILVPLRKYELVKNECDVLRKRYDDLMDAHALAVGQLELAQDKASRCKQQCEDLTKERNVAIRDRNVLKQQCGLARQRCDVAVQEHEVYRKELCKVMAERDEAIKEKASGELARIKLSKDIKVVAAERNSVQQDYSLVMSERDSVLKEMEKLSDDLLQSKKKIKVMEAQCKEHLEEGQKLNYLVETLRREIASALSDRDNAVKECNELREKFGEYTAKEESRELDKLEYDQLIGTSTNRKENDSGSDKFHQRKRERVENLDTANQEIDRLRKSNDKLQSELMEATQEAEVSKRRRDWAFSERDKIVSERDSLRTHCDNMRKQRDRAVSDKAETLRDSDDIKKQRNEALKELKELKEKIDLDTEKASRVHQFHTIGHNHSHDSAIDADMQEWETELVDLNLTVALESGGDIGFELSGGRDNPYYLNDSAVYVTNVTKGSVADGKLRVNDCIVRVNNTDCQSVSRRMVLEALGSGGPRCTLLVRRRRNNSRYLCTVHRQVQLPLTSNVDHGLSLESGLYISKISPGSLAAKEGTLAIGDRVLSINNNCMDGLTPHEAMCFLSKLSCDMLTITTLKQVSPSVSSSSANTPTHTDIGIDMRFVHNKDKSLGGSHNMTNSCLKPDDMTKTTIVGFEPELPQCDRKYVPGQSDRTAYKVTTAKHSDKGAWEMIRGKLDAAVRGRRHSKDKSRDKYRNSSPHALIQEQDDAMAQLDSAIDSGKTELSEIRKLKHSKRRNKDKDNESDMKNGDTWPKVRSNIILQQNMTGTIGLPRPKKDRLPLSLVFNNPPTFTQDPPPHCCDNRNSNPFPINVRPPSNTITNRHSVYGNVDNPSSQPSVHFSKSGQLLYSPKSFLPISASFDKSKPDYDHHDSGNRLSMNLTPSDNSLDYNKSPSSMDFITTKSPTSLEFPNKIQLGQEVQEYFTPKKMSSSKNQPKYSSDSESVGPDSLSSTRPSHSRIQSQLYAAQAGPAGPRGGPSLFPSLLPHNQPHPHTHTARYQSPITTSRSGESIGMNTSDRYCFEPPYSPSCHSHGASVDYSLVQPHAPVTSHRERDRDRDEFPYTQGYEGGTFPRNKAVVQRYRVPSNPSVISKNSAGKVSTGSVERTSERGSPMPTFHVEVLSPGNNPNKRNSLPDYCWSRKPSPGELRRVHIDKSVEPLGIQISCIDSRGVFVSTVTDNSLASQVGLQIGDQILEVCGINMRTATYEHAANVLRQCGNSITMLVQYNPDKYHEDGSVSGEEGVSRSGSPTPRNSPRPSRVPPLSVQGVQSEGSRAQGQTLTRRQIAQAVGTLQRQNAASSRSPEDTMLKTPPTVHEPRFLFIETRKCSNLGISLVGGNAVGIFVHSVQRASLAHSAGLRTGDQILEYNGADLRRATAEQAAYDLAKPADKVTVLVHYNLERYNEIKDKPGDSLYIRTGFDRSGDLGDSFQLRFAKDEVLYVDNTMFNGVPGNWQAWQLDSDGHRKNCGIIPSKYKVEEELLKRRSMGDLENEARRGTERRSFFRRNKKHQRSSSRDSKELASFSNITLDWYSDSGALNEEGASYQRVERLDYPVYRPVLIIGPLSDCVLDKLVADFPDKFRRCIPEIMHCSQAAVDKGVHDNVIVDYRKKGGYFECTTVTAVKDICDKNNHCIVDICVTSVERLHRHQIYPIVLLIRFKSSKQIKEVKDARYPMDKVSAKAAKEMFEHGLKLETDYRHYISSVIPAGVNIAYMCTQIKAAVDAEQNKTLWVPSAGL